MPAAGNGRPSCVPYGTAPVCRSGDQGRANALAPGPLWRRHGPGDSPIPPLRADHALLPRPKRTCTWPIPRSLNHDAFPSPTRPSRPSSVVCLRQARASGIEDCGPFNISEAVRPISRSKDLTDTPQADQTVETGPALVPRGVFLNTMDLASEMALRRFCGASKLRS